MRKTLTMVLFLGSLMFCLVSCISFTPSNNDTIANLSAQIDTLNSDVADKELQIATLEREKESLSSDKLKLETDITEFEAKINKLEARITELEAKNPEENTEIDNLIAEITLLESEKATLTEQVTKIEVSIAEKDYAIAKLIAEKQTLEDRLNELEAENSELKNENIALKLCIAGIHNGGAPTCKEKAKCTSCDTVYGELADHMYANEICTYCGFSNTPAPDSNTVAKLEKKQYSNNGSTINYWLYTPQNATENMPLIVYLHGGSGKGDDLELITAVDGFPQYIRDGKITPNAYVIIPQVSSSYRGWGEMKSDVMKLISFVTNEHQIDSNRISLMGHSMGGTGAWMLALAYPNTFSAVAPLSGSVELTDTNITKLKNMPVWAVVGTADTVVEPQSSIDFITELSKINKNAKITELDGIDHFTVPNATYLTDDFDIIGWLISQTKQSN